MGLTDFLLLAGAAVVGVLATAVYGMLALPAGYFRAARACAWMAAFLFVGLGILWAVETQSMFLVRALVVGGVAAVAAIVLTEALRQIAHHESHQETAEKKAEPSLDNVVQINCAPAKVPSVIPQNTMFELKLYWPGVVAGGSFMWPTGAPGTLIDLTSNAPSTAWLCRVSNFGPTSVINVEAEFVVNYRTSGAIADPIVYSGKIVLVPPINLSGNGGTCEIYVRNFAPDHFAELVLPATATGQMIGSSERTTFKLAASTFGGFILPPFKQIDPPKSDPVVPSPRPRPRGG
jgi:hypothetical protein